jgi:hypothetical protein
MREYAANDLVQQSLAKSLVLLEPKEVPPAGGKSEPDQSIVQYDKLIMQDNVHPDTVTWTEKIPIWIRRPVRQVIPGRSYPRYLRRRGRMSFDNYVTSVQSLTVPATPTTKVKAKDRNNNNSSSDDQPKSSSPTFFSLSQKIYDTEASRRESINARCTTVLSTAAILGTLVVAASQLGLTLRGAPITRVTLTVLAFFLVSLVYLAYSITIALHVHGDIQGEVIDFNDLNDSRPGTTLDEYNFNAAKALLICGKLNWCLNNNFKFRLQSAGRALRNGVIAVIVAGALSPWALTPPPTH